MRTAMLALAAGLLLLRFLPQLPPVSVLPFVLAAGLALLPFRWRAVGCFLCGFAWACHSAQDALDDRLAVELDGRTFWLEGMVSGLPDVRGGVVRFELVDITSRHSGLPSRLRLAWYGGPVMQAGERWRLAAKLKRPRGLVNPHPFDYEAWLLARRIGASGTIKAGERLSAAEGELAWRDQLRQRLLAVDAQGRSGALAALVVGDDSGLSTADWRVLQDTGTVHLMVISGQHIGMLAGLLYGLVALLVRWGVWPRRIAWLPCACGLALAGSLGYGWLAGFDVPVQRALVMVTLVLLWRLRYRQLGVWLPLLIALNGVLLLDPLVGLQSGFWLSFFCSGAACPGISWSAWQLALVARIRTRTVGHGSGSIADLAGAWLAGQPERTYRQPLCNASSQCGHRTPVVAGHGPVMAARRWRVAAMDCRRAVGNTF